MNNLPGYDNWKLATPPEYDNELTGDETCPECDDLLDDHQLPQDVDDAYGLLRAERDGDDVITCGECNDCRYNVSKYDVNVAREEARYAYADYLIDRRKDEGY